MKTLIRAFAFTLVLAGAVASTYGSKPSKSMDEKVSALPVPTCPPDDPNGCNIWNPPPGWPTLN